MRGRVCNKRAMWRMILGYALLLGLATTLLVWIEYRYWTQSFSTELYIALIAIGFAALGIWVGQRLTAPVSDGGGLNEAAIASLGLTARECEVLELLAAGQSNKEIARSLDISPNTVKTHVARLFEKLDVQRRTQAIDKARRLAIVR